MSAPNATSSNFSSASNSLFEVSIVGLIPDSLFSLLVDKLNALSVGSSSFELAETVYSPIVLAEGAKAEDGLLRVRRVDGKSYLTVLSRPESARTSPLASITPVLNSLVVGGADAGDVASHLGFTKSYAFRKRGLRFSFPSQLIAEVYKVKKDGETTESKGYVVEVRSVPIPHGATENAVQTLMATKKALVGLVELSRVDA